jgi:hypothetical protein
MRSDIDVMLLWLKSKLTGWLGTTGIKRVECMHQGEVRLGLGDESFGLGVVNVDANQSAQELDLSGIESEIGHRHTPRVKTLFCRRRSG